MIFICVGDSISGKTGKPVAGRKAGKGEGLLGLRGKEKELIV
jgi:hypothetical protein